MLIYILLGIVYCFNCKLLRVHFYEEFYILVIFWALYVLVDLFIMLLNIVEPTFNIKIIKSPPPKKKRNYQE